MFSLKQIYLLENQAKLVKKYKIDVDTLDYAHLGDNIRSIGYSPKSKEWYGWSHRAVNGFSSGEVLKYDIDNKYKKGYKIKNLKDAKKVAVAFADSVS
jgi:hypothetical protein